MSTTKRRAREKKHLKSKKIMSSKSEKALLKTKTKEVSSRKTRRKRLEGKTYT